MSSVAGEVGLASVAQHPVPYVGPRAFRVGEPFFARDREQRELADLLIAQRIVLLHAPSGAGKTSLIQAGLTPELEQRRFRPTVAMRVKTPPPENGQVHNRYAYSAALDLLTAEHEPEDLAHRSFDDVIAEAARQADGFLVLIFDQFEEILSIDPTDWKSQATFFKELGGALATDDHIWMLISMREDFIGGLDRFLRYLPGNLRATYRLDFLNRSAAKVAIQRPARELGIDFTDEAAAELVGRLAKVRVQRPPQGWEEIDAPYVQPFQLQVVCRKLWKSVSEEKGAAFRTIELTDVGRHADISRSLRHYYAGAVADVAKNTGADELAIRRWFETQLIADRRFRSQTLSGPTSGDVKPADILGALQDNYLIRSDTRAGSTWYELSHDTLVAAVVNDNQKWLRTHLDPWQLTARAWEEDRERTLLLEGLQLREVQRRSNSLELTRVEREFLDESARVDRERGLVNRTLRIASAFSVVVFAQLAVIVVLLVLLFTR